MLSPEIKEALIEIVGPESFTEALIDLVSYSYDVSDHSHRPEAAAWPTSTAQVASILELANRHLLPVTPRGAGTGLVGATVPARGGLVIDLGRMNRILAVEVADRRAVVQPGVVYADLQARLAREGFFYPPDPASAKICTIGGNVATNAGGIRGAKYGVTRDYVMGLEVVLPTGKIMRTGGSCIKSASGFDLTRMFVGSEGLLGVITEVTLKINPRPLAFCTAMAFFPRLGLAGQAVTRIMSSGVVPSVLEIMDRNTLRLLRERGGMDLPAAEAGLLVETDGFTQTEASFQMEKVNQCFEACGAVERRTADTPAQAEELWQMRRNFSPLSGSVARNAVSEDVTVPLSKVPEMLERVAGILDRHGLTFFIYGHAGDGNLHPKILYDKTVPDQRQRLEKAVAEIFGQTCELGGTLTGEHGIGLAKAPFMALEHDPEAMNLMRGLKKLVDPNNILNPGKVEEWGP